MENLNYYKLYTSSPFCGTDTTILIVANYEYEINEDEIKEDLFADYGYLINGWGSEEPTEEEYEDFIADCEVTLEKITKEQFDYEAEENGCDIWYAATEPQSAEGLEQENSKRPAAN